jgi:hypothetical protein
MIELPRRLPTSTARSFVAISKSWSRPIIWRLSADQRHARGRGSGLDGVAGRSLAHAVGICDALISKLPSDMSQSSGILCNGDPELAQTHHVARLGHQRAAESGHPRRASPGNASRRSDMPSWWAPTSRVGTSGRTCGPIRARPPIGRDASGARGNSGPSAAPGATPRRHSPAPLPGATPRRHSQRKGTAR